jgi:hypothetical protein
MTSDDLLISEDNCNFGELQYDPDMSSYESIQTSL